MSLRNTLLAACVVLASAAATTASAAETTSTFQSSASVPASCVVTTNASKHSVMFGAYDPVVAHATTGAQTRTGWATIEVTCNRQSAPLNLNISQGLNPSAGSSCADPLRNMVSATGGRLPYTLYVAAGPSPSNVALGCAENNHRVMSFEAAQKNSLGIQGRIPAGVDAPVGAYSDTVTASLVF